MSGEITFATNNTQVIFTPGSVAVPATLAYDTNYTVTLTTAVRDPSHNALAANVVWTFNTGKKLAIGFQHACARLDDGGVKCWGANEYGQLGYDDNAESWRHVRASHEHARPREPGRRAASPIALAAGDNSTCARLDNGDTKCWGSNEYGQLGQSTDNANQSIGDQPNEMETLQPINFGTGRFALEIVARRGLRVRAARRRHGQVLGAQHERSAGPRQHVRRWASTPATSRLRLPSFSEPA